MREMRSSVNAEDGEDFCLNFLEPLFENFDRRSCNNGIHELIPIFHNPLLRRWLVPFRGAL